MKLTKPEPPIRADIWPSPVVVLEPEEFDRVVTDLQNPDPPTESIKRGAELLRKLYPRT